MDLGQGLRYQMALKCILVAVITLMARATMVTNLIAMVTFTWYLAGLSIPKKQATCFLNISMDRLVIGRFLTNLKHICYLPATLRRRSSACNDSTKEENHFVQMVSGMSLTPVSFVKSQQSQDLVKRGDALLHSMPIHPTGVIVPQRNMRNWYHFVQLRKSIPDGISDWLRIATHRFPDMSLQPLTYFPV